MQVAIPNHSDCVSVAKEICPQEADRSLQIVEVTPYRCDPVRSQATTLFDWSNSGERWYIAFSGYGFEVLLRRINPRKEFADTPVTAIDDASENGGEVDLGIAPFSLHVSNSDAAVAQCSAPPTEQRRVGSAIERDGPDGSFEDVVVGLDATIVILTSAEVSADMGIQNSPADALWGRGSTGELIVWRLA